jgi:hypothetical protein
MIRTHLIAHSPLTIHDLHDTQVRLRGPFVLQAVELPYKKTPPDAGLFICQGL